MGEKRPGAAIPCAGAAFAGGLWPRGVGWWAVVQVVVVLVVVVGGPFVAVALVVVVMVLRVWP